MILICTIYFFSNFVDFIYFNKNYKNLFCILKKYEIKYKTKFELKWSYFKFNTLGITIKKMSQDGKTCSIVKVDSEMFALILLFLRGKFNDHIRINTRMFK